MNTAGPYYYLGISRLVLYRHQTEKYYIYETFGYKWN